MSRPVQAVAPARECARFLDSLRHNPCFESPMLADLAVLLEQYPPMAIVQAMEVACDQLVEEGRGPEWPDNGEADAFVVLTLGLEELAESTEQTLTTAA